MGPGALKRPLASEDSSNPPNILSAHASSAAVDVSADPNVVCCFVPLEMMLLSKPNAFSPAARGDGPGGVVHGLHPLERSRNTF